MKKILYILILLFAVIATACGSNAANGNNPASIPQGGPSTGALPATTQLIIGTIKLEGTDQAVTAEQAAELLPLWQTMQVLADSDTAADQEREALTTQIQETMTAGQMQTITDMNLTREDLMSIMQEQGLAMGAGPAGGQNSSAQNGNSSSNSGRNFTRNEEMPAGGMPPQGGVPGGAPGGGFGGGQGSGLSPDQIATAQAARQQGSGDFIPPVLINALIEYLQEKVGS